MKIHEQDDVLTITARTTAEKRRGIVMLVVGACLALSPVFLHVAQLGVPSRRLMPLGLAMIAILFGLYEIRQASEIITVLNRRSDQASMRTREGGKREMRVFRCNDIAGLELVEQEDGYGAPGWQLHLAFEAGGTLPLHDFLLEHRPTCEEWRERIARFLQVA